MPTTLPSLAVMGGQTYTVYVGTSGTAGAVVIANESPYSLQVSPGFGSAWIVAQTQDIVYCDTSAFNGALTITTDSYLSNSGSAPSFLLYLTVYAPGEPIRGTYPAPLARLANGVSLSTNSNVGPIFNVEFYGAKVDGVADDTAAVQAALNAANAAGSGMVYFPAGTCVCTTLTFYSYTHICGAGITASILQLKAGANGDLLQGTQAVANINLAAAFGTGSPNAGANNWTISDITLDGNKANQTTGPSYCLRVYGFGYILRNVRIHDGFSGGVLGDWNGGANAALDSMEAQWNNVKVHDCGGFNVELGGPHDSQFSNVVIYHAVNANLHLAPNALSMQLSNVHVFGDQAALGMLIESGDNLLANCEAEGSQTQNIALLSGNNTWIGGRIFGNSPNYSLANGIKLGQQAGETPYTGQILQSAGLTTAVTATGNLIDTLFTHCEGAHGCLWFDNDAGNNTVRANLFNTAGSAYTGTRNVTTLLNLVVNGISGGTNNTALATSGYLALRVDGPAALANGTNIVTASRSVLRVTETANVTGITMSTGAYGGQLFTVVNESAFTITFAASGTSNVADGVSDVIPATAARTYVYDSGTLLWYRLG